MDRVHIPDDLGPDGFPGRGQEAVVTAQAEGGVYAAAPDGSWSVFLPEEKHPAGSTPGGE